MTMARKSTIFEAQKILDLLDKDERLSGYNEDELYVTTFLHTLSNVGFKLNLCNPNSQFKELVIAFAAYPNSGHIVVYAGKPYTDEYESKSRFLENGMHFEVGRYKEIVEYIIILVNAFMSRGTDARVKEMEKHLLTLIRESD